MKAANSSDHDPAVGTPRRSSGGWWALLGLVLTVVGLGSYFAMVRQPFLRSSGVPIWIGAAAGLASSWLGWRNSRWLARVVVILNVALVAFVTFSFFVAFQLPAAPQLAKLERAPEFTLPDPTGNPVSLQRQLKTGPVLLVFYRGSW